MKKIKSNMNTPIYSFLQKYSASSPAVFHMPGHRLGLGVPEGFLKDMLSLDITEIPGSDNLHWPSGIIKEAQILAAEAFGAHKTFFLVNGATSGIHAMIAAACKEGDSLIIGRDSHSSVINGLMLTGAQPVYLQPQYDPDFGITKAIEPHQVEAALERNPEAAGVLVTRPNYYGVCSDLKAIEEIVHKRGKLLLVDEAHGAHLRFNKKLPACAMDLGADACVQSAHKTLPAPTQGAYLHVKGNRILIDKLKYYLDVYQTTSPSYIIMAYLDIVRALMEERGGFLLDQLMIYIGEVKNRISGLKGFRPLYSKDGGDIDPTRLVINVSGTGSTGFELQAHLSRNFNVHIEMADMYNIVCICTVSTLHTDFERLFEGLKAFVPRQGDKAIIGQTADFKLPALPPAAMTIKAAMAAEGTDVKLEEAAGRISRSVITPYPPGIPAIIPGEIITGQMAAYLSKTIEAGGFVAGFGESFEVSVVR